MKHGMNSAEMLKNNRTLVLKTLLENGRMTRTELAAHIGLQKATITNIINEFFELGIIVVDGEKASGRRGENICLKLEGLYSMSIGITRTDFKLGIYLLGGNQVENIKYSFQKNESFLNVVNKLKSLAVQMEEKYGKENCVGVCLAVPGPYFIRQSDELGIFQVSEFEELSQIDIRGELESALGRTIMVKHDAKLSAYAEWRNAKEARENRKVSLMSIRSAGFGVGAGLVINQKIVEGQLGIAGEIGHIGINYNKRRSKEEYEGTLEYCAGTESAVRYMKERLFEYPNSILNEDSNYLDIVNAYGQGDELATYSIDKMANMLGFGIANFIYMFNPDSIIIGPDYPKADAFIGKVKQVVSRYVDPIVMDSISIRYSELSYDSFLLGGYYYVLESLYSNNALLDKICER